MKHIYNKRGLFSMVVLTLLLAVMVPATALGQGRGRGHGRGGIFGSQHNKCGKFVNCHDARDGRWDGRGPRRDRVGNILLRNRLRTRRNRDFDEDRLVRRNRRLNRNNWSMWRNGRESRRRVINQ
ncbi:MAG TPA: hypothetical protein VK208_03345 [Pyrinomonadaceae bacterium]|nr:hypothetical protein [Pyrinomonadaceae bacterium]